ncbi:MAG TPA: DNA-directed RNA polymerase [Candidatus Diapherotrites archaeon]|nr:DNA-directed RNA polymerase [Candidatus Diapherotrites archaeon]
MMGYKRYDLDGIIAVSPLNLIGELKDIIKQQLCADYEGTIDKNIGLIIAVTDVLDYDEGEIVPNDPNVFYKVKFSVISFLPKLHEVVYGEVKQATDFGAFISIGPCEGLCHISQIMSEFNSYNPELPGFISKETKRVLKVGDHVLTRVVSVSFRSTLADSKIGLTMRQLGLGKQEWLKEDIKKEKKKTSKKEEKPQVKKKKVAK